MTSIVAIFKFIGLSVYEASKMSLSLRPNTSKIVYPLLIIYLVYSYINENLTTKRFIYASLISLLTLIILNTAIIMYTMLGWINAWHSNEN